MPAVTRRLVPPAVALLLAVPASGGAQGRDTVPLAMLPPAGKCRIWVSGVPAAQQPAPTDCATALRQRPANGVVLYGPASRDNATERFAPRGTQDARARDGSGTSTGEEQARRERDARLRAAQEQRMRDDAARRADPNARGTATTPPRGTNADPSSGASQGAGRTPSPPRANTTRPAAPERPPQATPPAPPAPKETKKPE